jgi:carotenoid cleavage dioxygenase-like enzyme
MQERSEKPFWLQGNMAPVLEEVTAFDLPVEGSIPLELRGLYARNGANPKDGHSGHWFLGDGMVHGVSIRDGKAEWYRNRWIRTPLFAGEAPRVPIEQSLANTSVVAHAGRIFALVENALPMEITRELGTAGFYDYSGKLTTPFTAHPKICPVTNELHFFGYSTRPPFLTYHVADAEGRLVRSLEISVPAPTMMHDFAMTRGHVIFMDLPVVFDAEAAKQGSMPFAWSDAHAARLGIVSRGAGAGRVRWIDIEPCYVFHVANAFEEDDGTIAIDAAWYKSLWRGGPMGAPSERPMLRRWRIAPGAAKATEETLDDRPAEFPRINDRLAGLPHSVVYAVGLGSDLISGRQSLLKYDLRNGKNVVREFENGLPSEFTYISCKNGGSEDEGWLMGFAYDRSRDASELLILNAQDIEGEFVARIRLPRRVPQGFHGNWLPEAGPGA